MNHKFWLRLSFGLLSLTAWTLPWQTKLILRSAASNYWEIAIFVGFVLMGLSLLALIPSGLLARRLLLRPTPIWRWSFRILLIASFASVFVSPDRTLSFYHWLILVGSWLFFLALTRCPRPWRLFFAEVFLASLAVQALLGLGQFFTQTSFASSYLGLAFHNAGDLGAAVVETVDGRWLRAYGASDHPNIFGGLMVLAALGSLYFFCQAEDRKRRIIFLAAYILFLTAALTSFSRAAFLALATGIVVFIWENRYLVRQNRRVAAGFFSLSLLIAGLFFWQYQDLILARVQPNNRLEEISLTDRRVFNRRAWQDFRRHPWLGTGLGTDTVFDQQSDLAIAKIQPAWQYQPAHNCWLLLASESGVFALLAAAMLWYLAGQKSRQRRLLNLFIALTILTLFDHWLFSLPLSAAWLFFLLALIW